MTGSGFSSLFWVPSNLRLSAGEPSRHSVCLVYPGEIKRESGRLLNIYAITLVNTQLAGSRTGLLDNEVFRLIENYPIAIEAQSSE